MSMSLEFKRKIAKEQGKFRIMPMPTTIICSRADNDLRSDFDAAAADGMDPRERTKWQTTPSFSN